MQARRARERRARIKAEEKAKEDQTRSAETVVGVLNAVAAVSVGEWAVMTADEQAAVTPPLARILTRLTDEQRAALDRYADPIALLGALGLWGWRVYQEAQARQPKPELVIDRTEVQPESPTPVMDLSLDEYRYRGTT